jgi:hypothetical protein
MMIRSWMTMMIKRTGIFLGLSVIFAMSLSGQTKDFQIWLEAKFQKDLNKDLGISAELGQRFRDNSTKYDRTLLTLDANYDLGKYRSAGFAVGGGVRFIMASNQESAISPRYRVHADATGEIGVKDVDLSLRVRFQYGFEEFTYFTSVRDNTFLNRYRLKAEYHIFGTRFSVDGYLEPWGLITGNRGRFFRRMRYSAGVSYTLDFVSELSFRYILEDEFNQVDPMRTTILVFGYTRDL